MRITVAITLDNKSDSEATVRIPAGSVFEAAKTEFGVQNVAIARDYIFRVPARTQIKVFAEGRCLNKTRGVPKAALGRITPFRYAGISFDQDSIWQTTSNPSLT